MRNRNDEEEWLGEGRLELASEAERETIDDDLVPEHERLVWGAQRAEPLDDAQAEQAYLDAVCEAIGEEQWPDDVRHAVICHFFPRGSSATLEQIGLAMRLSKERVRQIQDGALAKLRDHMRAHPRDAETFLLLGTRAWDEREVGDA